MISPLQWVLFWSVKNGLSNVVGGAYLLDLVFEEDVELGPTEGLTNKQVRSIDIGKSGVQFAIASRRALNEPRFKSMALHDLVIEVYVVLSCGGSNRLGPYRGVSTGTD
jgi:hypothetical protein